MYVIELSISGIKEWYVYIVYSYQSSNTECSKRLTDMTCENCCKRYDLGTTGNMDYGKCRCYDDE